MMIAISSVHSPLTVGNPRRRLLLSRDGGRTWSQPDTPTAETLYAISFADDKNGFVVGANGSLLRSTDGGATWAKQQVQLPDETGGMRPLDVNLFGVAAISPTNAFAWATSPVVVIALMAGLGLADAVFGFRQRYLQRRTPPPVPSS